MKKFTLSVFLLFCFFLSTQINYAQLKINEYSVSNYSSFPDNFGGYEDWIELYNSGATPINLTGYHLATKASNLTKWTFGNVIINPGNVLLVWASNHNVNTGANLHTNFKLKQCQGDRIILSNPSLVILDSMTLKKTQVTHSRGRTTDGSASWSVFKNPTPGATNNTATPYIDYTPTPVMSLVQGFYPAAQTLTITCADPSAIIKYTTTGASPSSSGITYFSAIAIPTTQVIRAQATSTNTSYLPSFNDNNTFFINVTHSVAVVSYYGDDAGTLMGGTQMLAETGVEYFNELGIYKTESFGQSNKHGNDSWSYPQRGIDFISRDEWGYNDALKYKIFNSKTRTEFQRIIFKASANDNYPFECPAAGNPYAWGDPTLYDAAHIRDAYVHTVAEKAGMNLDGRTWVPAVMYVNGQYWGVYDVREKVDDKDFTKYYYNSTEDSLQFLQTWGSTWSAYGGAQAQTDWNTFMSYMSANSMSVASNYTYVESIYNTKSLTDYVILNSYCVTSDWLNWNTAWWRGLNVACDKQKWRYTLWDEDATFHHYINYTGVPDLSTSANPCDPQSLGDPGNQGHIPILNNLLTNPTFKQYFVMRYFDLLNTGLSCTRMTNILDSMINVIKPEMNGQVAKWGGSVTAWQTNVTNMRNFIQARCDTMTRLFNSCYNVTGPYTIKINVDPPNSGTVDFNSLQLSTFIWQGTYPGNLPNNLAAHPKTNYCFSHWTTKTHTLSPGMNDSTVTLLLNANDSIVAHFIYNPTPTIVATSTYICSGSTVQVQASNGLNYNWMPSTGLSCTTCSNPIISPTVSTNYSVTSVASSSLSCQATATQFIAVTANPQVTSSPTGSTICVGNNIHLISTNGVNYNWLPTMGLSCFTCSNPIASPSVTTIYTVTSNASLLCKTTSTLAVNVISYANAAFTATNVVSAFPQVLNIANTSTSATSYYWSLSNGSTATTTVPSFVVNSAGTYTLTLIAYNGNGCNDTTTSTIVVSDIDVVLPPSIVIPNVFTPNKDGVNDLFYPVLTSFKEMTCTIYDRWGVMVYELKELQDKWSGENVHGKEVPAGSYFYVFTGVDINGKNYVRKGYVTLSR
jgi:gliding motility-associated-like protein